MSQSGDVYNTFRIGPNTDPWGTSQVLTARCCPLHADYLLTILKVGLKPAQGFSVITKATGESLQKTLVITVPKTADRSRRRKIKED